MANKIPYPDFWLDKPYYSLNAYLRKQYGQKVYKLSLDASFPVPTGMERWTPEVVFSAAVEEVVIFPSK